MFSLDPVYSIYSQFLSFFPENIHWLVSIVLAILLIVAVYKILRKQFIYIILLVILLPASAPILKSIWQSLMEILRFLLSRN